MTTLQDSTVERGTLADTSLTTIYAAGSSSKEETVTLIFMNLDNDVCTLDLFSGGSADENRMVAQPISIRSKGMVELELAMAPDEDIRAQAGAGNVVVWVRKARIVE